MLTIVVRGVEGWDEQKEEFVPASPPVSLNLEHSLLSLSKWESKWEKPFLSKEQKTVEETIDYIRCMTLNSNVPADVYDRLSSQNFRDVNAYIDAKRSATTIREEQKGHRSTEIVTSELIYYWMVALQIPFECQKWHLNRLLTLIRVCNVKNSPGKKMGRNALLNRYASLNKKRREAMHSNG